LKSASIVAKINQKLVVLGTGGTIAGTAASSADHTGYTAAQIGVAQLLASVVGLPQALQNHELVAEQLAQIDSKDMDFATMTQLAQRCAYWLAQPDVTAVVVTHGTDTLEETAWFLHLTLPAQLQAAKPVVFTCAMRPATSNESDGPRNMLDAVRVALASDARGVLAVCAGLVHHAAYIQKIQSHALSAFSSDNAGHVGRLVEGQVHWGSLNFSEEKTLPAHLNKGLIAIDLIVNTPVWPRVELVFNHAGCDGAMVRSLLADRTSPVRGIVVAATGNGTLSQALTQALQEAIEHGVSVLRSTRCVFGSVTEVAGNRLPHTPLVPLKARILLVLQLLAGKA
jgi:L-asparaginase